MNALRKVKVEIIKNFLVCIVLYFFGIKFFCFVGFVTDGNNGTFHRFL